MKKIANLGKPKGMIDDMLEKKIVDPTKVVERIQESMAHMKYRLDQSRDWRLNLELEAEGLCSLKVKEINDKTKRWRQYIRENE